MDWLTNRLLTSGVELFDDVPDTIRNGPGLKQDKVYGHLLNLMTLTGRVGIPKGFIVYKGSEYNEVVSSSCTTAIGNKRRDLMQFGKNEKWGFD